MRKIPLNSNHKRATSSTVYLLENLISEIESIITTEHNAVLTEVYTDESDIRKTEILKTVDAIRKHIGYFAQKYDLTRQEVVQSRYIAARKTKMWEMLNNTKPQRLKGFGEFPAEYKVEFESDLDDLIGLVESYR